MRNNPRIWKVIYIISIPLVLLVMLYNAGWLQRLIPAASINGENYSVVRYNYYYYDYRANFLLDNLNKLDELGYDPKLNPKKQNYNSFMTWQEFFCREAETKMAETAYYCSLAEQAGYTFSEQELAPVALRVAENAAGAAAGGIGTRNYYIARYGKGMTEKLYTEELTRVVKAQIYKQHLIDSYRPDDTALKAYLSENPGEEYSAVRLQVIMLSATPDRASGKIGRPQLDALQSKLNALIARYESGVPFDQLQQAFSDMEAGTIFLTRATELPAAFISHYIDTQTDLSPQESDEHFNFVDESTGRAYFAVSIGYGGNGPALEAATVLGPEAVESQQAEHIAAYMPQRKSLGMLLAAS